MDVFYAPPGHFDGGAVTLRGDELHHLARVMRLREGARIHIADGAGLMVRARIERLTPEAAFCLITERLPRLHEATRDVVLVQALLKNPGKMDWIVEKAVELGVGRIMPVRSARSIASADKGARWRAIALAAMKQCERCVWPGVDAAVPLQDALDLLGDAAVLCCHEEADAADTIERAVAGLPPGRPIACVIGPEGGFDEQEVALVRARGGLVVSLGTRRLRSETAAVAALARLSL
ncbi:MAG: 16S rRNA (uracil(1498)-N(3))-methyltransferase [Ignavibacteria bacterium]|nr:16S rRNA (uracil(1498)-N(3))-methyltransferase [Ignavibacteria bacterium]